MVCGRETYTFPLKRNGRACELAVYLEHLSRTFEVKNLDRAKVFRTRLCFYERASPRTARHERAYRDFCGAVLDVFENRMLDDDLMPGSMSSVTSYCVHMIFS